MKIAILLCGQLRTFDMCKWNVKNMLQDRYDCDVFMSIDKNNSHQLENLNSNISTNNEYIKEAIDFIKPIKYYIVDDNAFNKDFNSFKMDPIIKFPSKSQQLIDKHIIKSDIIETDFTNSEYLKFKKPFYNTSENQYSVWYKKMYLKELRQYFTVSQCYKMVIDHIRNTGIKYDLVIRLRFDQLIWSENDDWLSMCEKNRENGPVYNKNNIDIIKNTSAQASLKLVISEENTISVFGGGIVKTYGYVNDFFWMHGIDLIQTMSQFYNKMFRIINQTHREHMPYSGANIEHIFLRFIFENNIKIKRTKIAGRIVREFII
jgi:hypothetical protein